MFDKAVIAWQLLNLRKLAITIASCPLCDKQGVFIRLNDSAIGTRCMRCGASAITMSLVAVIKSLIPDLGSKSVYELSSRGPFYNFLGRNARNLTRSEFFDDIPPGELKDGVQCQDVERLTYLDHSFDICSSTEVFEHVADDLKGFSEIRRVLKPNGLFIFTVPLNSSFQTIERARRLPSGEIQHLLPPEYHGDSLRGQGRVLAFRNYGTDICQKLESQGFSHAEIVQPSHPIPWGHRHPVIVAHKGNAHKAKDGD